jgi:integrase
MRRGKPGTGVEALKSSIRVRFTHEGVRRSVTLKMAPTQTNIGSAERLMVRVRRDIDLGIFDYRRHFPKSCEAITGTFSEFAKTYLGALVVTKSTMASYRQAIENIWLPTFGERHLADIKASEIRLWVRARRENVSPRTINNHLIPLRGLFRLAIEDGLLDLSPLASIRNLKIQRSLPDPFTSAEMEAILSHLRSRAPEQAWNWYEFAFGTGLRPSEQIAARWSDIDWQTPAIRIQRAKVRGEIKPTKTYEMRDVDLNDRMIAVLERQKLRSFENGLNTPIFLNPATGKPWPASDDQRKSYFQPALAALSIRKRNAYHTRHTFATIALMGGVNPAYIARQLGHSNAGTLFKHYARWIEDSERRKEVRKMNALFAPSAAQ